jgi:hypothetical protein
VARDEVMGGDQMRDVDDHGGVLLVRECPTSRLYPSRRSPSCWRRRAGRQHLPARARATLDQAHSPVAAAAGGQRPDSPRERRLVEEFVRVWHDRDIPALAALLRDDAAANGQRPAEGECQVGMLQGSVNGWFSFACGEFGPGRDGCR